MRKLNLITFILLTLIISFTFLSLEKSNGQMTSSSSGDCIVCTQVIPNCSTNQILIPQSCNECAHCVTTSSTSSGCLQVQTDCVGEPSGCGAKFGIYDPKICKCVCPISSSSGNLSCTTDNDCPPGLCSSSGTFKNYSCGNGICNQIFYFADPCQFSSPVLLNKNFTGVWKNKTSKKITLKLCIKEQRLEGTVNIPGELENENITSQEIISNKEINITTTNRNNIKLTLSDNRHLIISFNSQTFELRKTSLLKTCSF